MSEERYTGVSQREHFYLYALVRAADVAPIQAAAVAEPDNPLFFIACGRLAMLVSRIAQAEVLAIRRNMMAHTRVLERLMETRTLLPMRFGVIISNEAILHETVTPAEDRLLGMLDAMDGRLEVGIRAGLHDGVLFREIATGDTALGREAAAINRRDPSETYYERIEIGRRIENEMTHRRLAEARRLIALLKPFAVEIKELGRQDDSIFANLALLVDRAAEPALLATVEALEKAETERLTIKYVAPVPPYNFVAVNLDWRASESRARHARKDAA